MSTTHHQRTKALFHAALARPQDDRLRWLREACDGNESLFLEVLSLLQYHDERPLLRGRLGDVVEQVGDACHRVATLRASRVVQSIRTERVRTPRRRKPPEGTET